MPDSDKFDFDSLMDDDLPDSNDDFFNFDDEPGSKKEPAPDDKFDDDIIPDEDIIEPDYSVQKR